MNARQRKQLKQRLAGSVANFLYNLHKRYGLLRWHLPAKLEDYLHCIAYPEDL
jgi:hypothetical protein